MILPYTSSLQTRRTCFVVPPLDCWFAHHLQMPYPSSGIFEGLSSRLIPRSYFTPEQVPKLVDAILAGQQILTDAGTYGSFGVLLVPPAKQGTHNAPHTSINPVWYDSLWHVVYGGKSPVVTRCLLTLMFGISVLGRQALGNLLELLAKLPAHLGPSRLTQVPIRTRLVRTVTLRVSPAYARADSCIE